MMENLTKEDILLFLTGMRNQYRTAGWPLGDLSDEQIRQEVDQYLSLREEHGLNWMMRNKNKSVLGLLEARSTNLAIRYRTERRWNILRKRSAARMEEFYPKEYFLKFLLEMRDIHKSRDWHELGDMTDQQIEWEVDNYIRLRDERGMDWLSENENESFIGLLRAHK